MTTPPRKGGNGAAGSPVLGAAAKAVEKALTARPSGLLVPESLQAASLPYLGAFLAEEIPQPAPPPGVKQARVFQLAWIFRVALLSTDGRGVAFQFAEGQAARSIAGGLRAMADRIDQLAEAVEKGEPLPAPDGSGPPAKGDEQPAGNDPAKDG